MSELIEVVTDSKLSNKQLARIEAALKARDIIVHRGLMLAKVPDQFDIYDIMSLADWIIGEDYDPDEGTYPLSGMISDRLDCSNEESPKGTDDPRFKSNPMNLLLDGSYDEAEVEGDE